MKNLPIILLSLFFLLACETLKRNEDDIEKITKEAAEELVDNAIAELNKSE